MMKFDRTISRGKKLQNFTLILHLSSLVQLSVETQKITIFEKSKSSKDLQKEEKWYI